MRSAKSIFTLSLLFIFSININSQNDLKIENLKAFAKIYGYVKYFHPSDEAVEIDWNKFSIYGAEQIEKCQTKEDLILTLNQLFQPIAPSIRFYYSKTKLKYNFQKITPNNPKNHLLTYWQHRGVSTGMHYQFAGSVRINRTMNIDLSSKKGNIMTSIDATNYRGKQIKYSGWVKIQDDTKGTGYLWIKVDVSNKTGWNRNNKYSQPFTENKWKQYETMVNVDSLATSLTFICQLKDKGRLNLDKIELSYKEGNNWIKIPLKNSGFETDSLTGKNNKDQWIYKGKGYSFNTDNNEHYEGKKSAKIEFIGEIKTEKGKQLFDYEPKFGELIEKQIGSDLYCQIPLVLYCSKENTFPIAKDEILSVLEKELANTKVNPKELSLRLGNVINVYNVFQHFYPYFDVVDVNWEQELKKALIRCYSDKTDKDHFITLEKFTAPLKDGHIAIGSKSLVTYVPPISWEWIEDKLVITSVYNDNINVNVGDIVTHINNQSSADYFKEIHSRISAATIGWLNYRAKTKSLFGEKDSKLIITINNKNIELIRDFNQYKESRPTITKKESYRIISDSIYYLNLDIISMDNINKLMPQLEKCSSIIFDLRGYPNNNHELISHLLKINDTTSAWMKVSQIVYPDHENLIGYENHGWFMKTKKPYLGDKKIIFIINSRAISYAESYMGYIEGYKLATIIGQPTAGTNGNINPFKLPGGYHINWTGMKVVKHNGSQHHGIGIIPNIYVHKTIEGIKLGKDEFLEKAIEIAKQK